MKIKGQLKLLLKEVVRDLVDGYYGRIQTKLAEELVVEDLKAELTYWGLLSMPPDEAFDQPKLIQSNNGSLYTMDFALWINHEESDLILSCEANVYNGCVESFHITNLHAL
jgi:hypothetical protein